MTRGGRIGPLSMLACCLLPVAGAFAVTTTRVGAITLAADLLALGWLVRDPRATAARMAVGLVGALTLALSTWLYAGQDADRTAAAALRVLCIVVPAAIVSPLIGPSALGDHLAQRLRLPARPVAAAVAAMQRVGQLSQQWQQIQHARRARGLGSDGGPIRKVQALSGSAFALLVGSMRHTGQLAMAMDARGFATAQRRTWALAAPWRAGDWLLLSVSVALAALPWLL
ncbi:MAG: energy-coupling factor transporter transmembrane component T family protein [Nocardioidaceae bacterium]